LEFFTPGEIPFDELPNFYQDMLHHALEGRSEPVYLPPFSTAESVNPVEIVRPLIGSEVYIGAGAHTVIVNPRGELLMVERSEDGYWSLPGGYSHLGENVAYTAVREAKEETGLDVGIERLMGVMSPLPPWVYPNGDQSQTVVSVFLARPVGGTPHPDQDETSQVRWMEVEEVLALETHPTLKRLNQAVVEHLDGGVFVV